MKQLFFAASLLLLLASCNTPGATSSDAVSSTTTETSATVTSSDIAYVNMDLVIAESDIFQKEGLPLQQRTETAQREWAEKNQKLQSEAAQLQQKYQNGLITTANAQKSQQTIESRAKSYGEAAQKQMGELEEENTVFSNRTQLLLHSAIDNVNTGKKYKMIINASALIDADSTLDISNMVLEEFNKLYSEEKAE